jgi:hypothetical protein
MESYKFFTDYNIDYIVIPSCSEFSIYVEA